MIYYGFDPGKTTGVVALNVVEKKAMPAMLPTEMNEDELHEFLSNHLLLPATFIVEGFWLEPYKDPKNRLAWDPMLASQMIGMIKFAAKTNRIEIVTQKNSDKPVGYGFANLKYVPGKKATHWQDAMAHVYFYLVKNQIAFPASAR